MILETRAMQTTTATLKPQLGSKETVITPVLKLEEQLAEARRSATEALLAERRCIDAALQKIGYDGEHTAQNKGGAKLSRVCSACGQQGHNRRSCPSNTSLVKSSNP